VNTWLGGPRYEYTTPNPGTDHRAQRDKKKSYENLRQIQQANELTPKKRNHVCDSTSKFATVEEEEQARRSATVEQVKVFRTQLPALLSQLSKIPDPRNPKKIKHRLTVLILYGILTFVYQMTSRREANRVMTQPQFMENLRFLFPELESIPHNDSLNRLLASINVTQIEQAHINLVRRLIRNKKFSRYLVNLCYPIAIDGTQKFKRDEIWSEECSGRTVGKGETTRPQYYVYILEASLVFHNGLIIPLMSEFLEYTKGDISEKKEDCEIKAFKRLAGRLKNEFKRLNIMILLDGLYPNGPIMEICRKNKWDFMIVLQDKSLPTVWSEFYGLQKLQTEQKIKMNWGERRQEFEWINDIEYYYGQNQKKHMTLHVVTCKESWEEVDSSSCEIIIRTSRHAWISSKPLTEDNVHDRCNLLARHRWGIETNILIEKRHGYQYEHCFSYNWNAMKGYHYLMRLAHLFNVLSEYSESLSSQIKETGIRNLIHFIRNTLTGPWLHADIERIIMAPHQLRLL